MKFYDCSLSGKVNIHDARNLGPVENDIMRDLGVYASEFGHTRCDIDDKPDVIITNTTFPVDVIQYARRNGVPLVKRMDGIYYIANSMDKNIALNDAAMAADHVIFISEHSRNALFRLYGWLPKRYSIILNNADNSVFTKRTTDQYNGRWATSSTNWSRPEKRLQAVVDLAEAMTGDDRIFLIGRCDQRLPDNIIKVGYLNTQQEMATVLRGCCAYFAPHFQDSCSKTTCQAIQCRLPVLYADPGGFPEVVGTNGVAVHETDNVISRRTSIPRLDVGSIFGAYMVFKREYYRIMKDFKTPVSYMKTLGDYYAVMESMAERY